jgi:cation diffusion facilitator family transporter
LESIINVFTSGFAFYSLYLAELPKDENHPYGHGKVEYLSVGFEGALIVMAGAYILYSATLSLIHPQPVGRADWGVVLMAGTAAVNLGVGLLLVRNGKQLKSVALVGDGQHLYIDALTSIVSAAALVLVAVTGQVRFDAGAALLLGGFILVNGARMLRRSVSGLMDETDTAIVTEVIEELQAHRRAPWIDVHNLRVQRYGANLHIDCHMQMPYYFTLEEVHSQLFDIEELIKERFAVEVEMFVHADPCTFAACSLCLMADCPVRQHPFRHEMLWTLQNAVRNERHRLG